MRTISIPIIAALLISCAELVPQDYDKVFNNYNRLTIENDFHTLHMASMGSQYQQLVFDVEIINHSTDTIIFDPVSIVYYGSLSPFPVSYGNVDIHELTRPNAIGHKFYPAISPQHLITLDETNNENPTLRKELLYDGEILTGEHYRGKVFFPKPHKFKYYRFVIFLGRADYVFDFRVKSSSAGVIGVRNQTVAY